MYEAIFKQLRKPRLHQLGKLPFWHDEHISKQMLAAHLDPNTDAASRRPAFIDESVEWLSSIIPSGGRLLDLGCGPGLYTKRLSERGYDVTGIDISARSIEYARSQDAKTEYIHRNYLELGYGETFDAVTLIYCDYAALIRPMREVLLKKVNRALKMGGLFIFDVFTSARANWGNDKKTWSYNKNGSFWCAEPHLCLRATHYYENQTVSVDQTVVITENDTREYLIWDAVFTRESLLDEALPMGFSLRGFYDDVRGREYSGGGDMICVVLEKTESI